ncbi:M17 family peptidase N-terminal domain-containing protein [Pendulispora albinea]|uniref:Leucyl aminopeptidase n=1 Tax=Pendulispora albinea TaxID=2741071 RepID=A0ABZ2M3L9_9BACT
MDLRYLPHDLRRIDEANAEVVACAIWQDEVPMRGLAGLLDWRLAGKLSALQRADYLRGEAGEVLCVPGRPRLPFDKVLVFGLGPRPPQGFEEARFRETVLHLLRTLEGLHVPRAVVELPGRADASILPDRAATVVLECVGTSAAHDTWWIVDHADAERHLLERAQEEQRRARRA